MYVKLAGLLLGLMGSLVVMPAMADTNVALGAAVTLNGVFGVTGPSGLASWGAGILAPASALTSGVFQPEETQWNQNSVFWDTSVAGTANNTIDINLGGSFNIDSLIVQADDNDNYQVQYLSNGGWQTLWNAAPVSSWGLVTRNSGLFTPVTTSELQIVETGGDGYYAVSQIEAFGTPAVPEPETYALLALGGLAVFARRSRR